jgi:hypothetical protein
MKFDSTDSNSVEKPFYLTFSEDKSLIIFLFELLKDKPAGELKEGSGWRIQSDYLLYDLGTDIVVDTLIDKDTHRYFHFFIEDREKAMIKWKQ